MKNKLVQESIDNLFGIGKRINTLREEMGAVMQGLLEISGELDELKDINCALYEEIEKAEKGEEAEKNK